MFQRTCYIVRGGALGIRQGGATQGASLWHCLSGRGWRRNNATCSALGWLSVTFPTNHKQIGPFWCWCPGVWFCVCFRTLWVSPTNSPVRLGVSPTDSTPTGFFSEKFRGFISPCWNPGLLVCLAPQLFLLAYLHANVGLPWSASGHLALSPLCPCCPCLDECFFFNSLVVRLPHSSIFWQFWLFFVFKFVVVLLLVVWGGKVYPPMPPSWPEVLPSLLRAKVMPSFWKGSSFALSLSGK